jgi:hypothetical protein
MRREWRNVLVAFMLSLLGTRTTTAQQDMGKDAPGSGGDLVRLTLDLSWGMQGNEAIPPGASPDGGGSRADRELVLELSEGRVIDAVTWPPEEWRAEAASMLSSAEIGRGPGPNGSWR